MERKLNKAAQAVIDRMDKAEARMKKTRPSPDPELDMPKLKADAQASLDRLSVIASAGLDVVAMYHSSGTAQMIEDIRVALDQAEEFFAAKELN